MPKHQASAPLAAVERALPTDHSPACPAPIDEAVRKAVERALAERVINARPPAKRSAEPVWYQRAALGLTEASDVLGVTRQFLARLARNGELRVVKLGRRSLVPVSEIRRIIGEADVAGGDAP